MVTGTRLVGEGKKSCDAIRLIAIRHDGVRCHVVRLKMVSHDNLIIEFDIIGYRYRETES